MHSALQASEKIHALEAFLEGKPVVVIGARSAVFAPVHNLGIIIVDEEHENSYKQDQPNPDTTHV